jgi:hypothetical protein
LPWYVDQSAPNPEDLGVVAAAPLEAVSGITPVSTSATRAGNHGRVRIGTAVY